jgi:acetyl esterase/lipase
MPKLSYGSHTDQFGHLYRPSGQIERPVLIVIHGGYWKDNHTLESYATNAIVEKFKTSGAAVWNLEYRRMNTDGDNTKAPWPAVFQDVAAGIDYLRSIAKTECLDLNRILVVGHSAGGQLAAWAASRASIPRSSELYCADPLVPTRVMSIAGILDLRQSHDLSQPLQVERLLGGSIDEYPERYAAANPVQLHAATVPMTFVHGVLDEDVAITQQEIYASTSENPNLQLVRMEDADHFGMLPLDGQEPPDWPRLVDIIAAELEQLGAHRPIDPELLPVNETRPASMGPISSRNIEVARQLSAEAREMSSDPAPDIQGVRHVVEAEHGNTDVFVYQPESVNRRHVLLWFHGGGYIMGTGNDYLGKQLASDVGCTVVSVDYRLAPEHPFPAGVNDGVSALGWLYENASMLGVDADKIGIGGASAGAGLAAGVALFCRHATHPMPVFQLLMYPMLDNLHATTSGSVAEYPIWNRATSLNAWEMYLGEDPGVDASPYAAPSRATDLSGLPSTYLCVGDADLFRDENVAFMQKFIADGSPGEFEIYPGVYHAAENHYPDAKVSKRMYADTLEKLRKGLLIR